MEHNVLDDIRMQALNTIDWLQDEINIKQVEINKLKEEQKKLRSVVKAASDKPERTNTSKKPAAGIRDITRHAMIGLIHAVDPEEFTVPILVEKASTHDTLKNMAESTIARAINVLREEGLVRQIGVEGRAPLYKYVGGE